MKKPSKTKKKWTPALILTTILVSVPLASCANEHFFDITLFSPTDSNNADAIILSLVLALLFLLLDKKLGNDMSGENKKEAKKILRSMGLKPKEKENDSILYKTIFTALLLVPLFYFGLLLPAGKLYTNYYGTPYTSHLIVSKKNSASKFCQFSPFINSEQLNGLILNRPLCLSNSDFKLLPENDGVIEVSGNKSVIGHTISSYAAINYKNPDYYKTINQKKSLLQEWKDTP